MKSRRVLRYLCDFCNKGYWEKKKCLRHEPLCLKNPERIWRSPTVYGTLHDQVSAEAPSQQDTDDFRKRTLEDLKHNRVIVEGDSTLTRIRDLERDLDTMRTLNAELEDSRKKVLTDNEYLRKQLAQDSKEVSGE